MRPWHPHLECRAIGHALYMLKSNLQLLTGAPKKEGTSFFIADICILYSILSVLSVGYSCMYNQLTANTTSVKDKKESDVWKKEPRGVRYKVSESAFCRYPRQSLAVNSNPNPSARVDFLFSGSSALKQVVIFELCKIFLIPTDDFFADVMR